MGKQGLKKKSETEKGGEGQSSDEGAKRDGSTGVGKERLKVGRNKGFENALETEKGESLAGYEEAKIDGTEDVG